jgi:20S proteasome alpha/beta subunit
VTAVVGVLCTDGVVVGTDSSVTFAHGQFRTIEQTAEKLDVIGDSIIVAGTGSVGLGQRFCEVVKQSWDAKAFSRLSPVEVGKDLCSKGLADFGATLVSAGSYGALVAFLSGGRPHLCELDPATFQPELKTERIWYASLGSSQPITDPFLGLMRRVFWADGRPTVRDAVFVVTWALHHAIEVNPGGVNAPERIAVLEKSGGKYSARVLEDQELDEHRQSIADAMERLRSFREDIGANRDEEGVAAVPTAGD